MNNASGAITSASARNWTKVANTVSKSRSVLACRIWSCSPRVRAADCKFSRYVLCHKGAGRVDEERNDIRRGYQLAQQLQPLRPQLRVQVGHARDIAARSGKAGDKSSRDRVSSHLEDDGNRRWSPPLPPVPQACYRAQQSRSPDGEPNRPPTPAIDHSGRPPSGIRS